MVPILDDVLAVSHEVQGSEIGQAGGRGPAESRNGIQLCTITKM